MPTAEYSRGYAAQPQNDEAGLTALDSNDMPPS
jgi:hypothetical protein